MTRAAPRPRTTSERSSPAPRWRSSMAASPTIPSSSRPNSTSLDLKVEALPGVGSESAKLLERLGIRTIGELLWHLPTRYLDYGNVRPVRQLIADREQTTEAIVGAHVQHRDA